MRQQVQSYRLCIAAGVLLAGGVQVSVSVAADSAQVTAADREVTSFRQHLTTLANPFFEGRGPGTRGNELAAEYFEFYFKQLGLVPAFPGVERAADGTEVLTPRTSYRQEFTAGSDTVSGASSVSFGRPGQERVLKEDEDFVVLGFSGGTEAPGITAPLAFAGYSIHTGRGKGDGYATYTSDQQLDGKIAMILRFEPMDDKGESKWIERTADGEPVGGTPWTSASAIGEKIQSAIRRGAVGVILVNPPGCADERSQTMETTRGTTRWVRNSTLPAVQLSTSAADRLLRAADPQGRGLMDFRRMADEKGEVVDLGTSDVRVTLNTNIRRAPRTTWNVAGVLPGRGDLAEEYVIVGGHYDHVGYGYTGGSLADAYGIIHPGADDNASGASGILLAAEIFRKRRQEADPGTPMRSIMFIGFSAEEMGLIGSRHFVQNSPVSASAVYAMLNMDMIGRLRNNTVELSGTGTAQGFRELLEAPVQRSGLSIDLDASPGGQGPSDHASFYAAGVPVLHFFTGLHGEYHRPTDTFETIEFEGAVHVVRLVCDVTEVLTARPEPLVFQSGRARGARDGNRERPLPAPAGPSMRDMKVRFGISPANYADGEKGVGVGDVHPGTSAADAGIQQGDRLVRWNGAEIEDVAAWMGMMVAHNPGDIVDVTLVRAGREEVVRVTLKGRENVDR